jgi:endonuclease/exonuclease/phosphatase family metal-dependent hydrolase
MTSLKILSYNILDVELESNFVPRSMHPSSIKAIIQATPSTDFVFPVKDEKTQTIMNVLGNAYLPFHKGFKTTAGVEINKTASRELWAKENVTKEETAPNRNLIQKLTDIFGFEEAARLYKEIKDFNDANNKWDAPNGNNRLNRVFKKIISYDADIICLQEYGNCKDLPNKSKMQLEFEKPLNNVSTFAYQENVNNDQNAVPENGSLANKLMLKGYHYKLFSHNPYKNDGDDGLAIFYKDETFIREDNKTYVDMDADNKQKSYIDKKTDKPKYYETQRGCGLIELTTRNSPSQKVVICTTHIQTSTNEPNPKGGDGYEIRRGELEYIKKHIKDTYTTGTPVIFCGDLNLDLNTKDKGVIDDFEKDFLTRIKSRPTDDDLGLVTSYPSLRQEYLDYFFTNCGGTVTGDYKPMSDVVAAKKAGNPDVIPNSSDQPSDHIPILLTIVLPPQKGGSRKSRKRRRKTQKKPKRKTRRNNKRKISKSKK